MKIIITIGDVNGIGIEVLIKALNSLPSDMYKTHSFAVAGNIESIAEYVSIINTKTKVDNESLVLSNTSIPIINVGDYAPVKLGEITESAGKLAAACIRKAANLCLAGEFDGMVTMPISKEALHLAGEPFPGHTEMLAHICNAYMPLMILCSRSVRVALATIHIAIKDVPSSISAPLLSNTISLFNNSLILDYGITAPKIACLSLNPHAGENGDIGLEEINIIKPSIEELKSKNININGPFAADGFFGHGDYEKYDGILAMYHDQGLIPLKLLARGAGVNFTAGLPIVRTSPDHGTAFTIAGKDTADAKSTLEAIHLALDIASKRAI